jgi:hypothetical protein
MKKLSPQDHLQTITMRQLTRTIAMLLIMQPLFFATVPAEADDPQPNPQELSAGIQNCWNWLESLSGFQPYLPANIPSQKQWGVLSLLTARKCQLRGEWSFEKRYVTEAQARAGDEKGLLATFLEFGIKPEQQAEHLAQLAFATKSEPMRTEELRNEPALFRIYCLTLADEFEQVGQFEKSIEVLSRLPVEKDGYLLVFPYAKAGKFDQAMKILALERERKERNPYHLERGLASHLARAGKQEEARQMLATYLADVRKLKTPDERLREAYFAAGLLKEFGDESQRRSFLTDCEKWDEEETARETDVSSKSRGPFFLARTAINAGDQEFAKKSITRAVKLLRESTRKDDWVLAHYASLQASLDLVAESKQTAKEAISIARQSTDEYKRDSNLSSVVNHLPIYRNEALMDAIDVTMAEIHTLTWRALAFRAVVELEISHEQWDRAKRHLAEGHDYLRRKEIDRTEAFVHQFELDLLAARMHAKRGDKAVAQKLLQELFRRGYSLAAGDFTEKVYTEQREAGFLEDAWRTATWIPELDKRYRALSLVMDSAVSMKRVNAP